MPVTKYKESYYRSDSITISELVKVLQACPDQNGRVLMLDQNNWHVSPNQIVEIYGDIILKSTQTKIE